MTQRVPVKDNTLGATIQMWEVDAEEAVRRDAVRFTHLAVKPPPVKNPGGRGW
jgi:hypothetical protein